MPPSFNILPRHHTQHRSVILHRSVDECLFVCADYVNLLLLNYQKIVPDSFYWRFSVTERHICITSSSLGINTTQHTTMQYSILYMTSYSLKLLIIIYFPSFSGIFHTFCTEGLAHHLIIPYTQSWLHLLSWNQHSINNSTIHHILFPDPNPYKWQDILSLAHCKPTWHANKTS